MIHIRALRNIYTCVVNQQVKCVFTSAEIHLRVSVAFETTIRMFYKNTSII